MKKRARLLLVRILIRLGVLSSFFVLLYIYFFSGLFTIHTYELIGIEDKYKEEITQSLHTIAETTMYGFLPGNRSITPQRKEIKNLINETLPTTASIKIYASSLHTLTIAITSYEPLFAVSSTHAITRDGVIYKEVDSIEGLPIITIATTTQVSPKVLASLSKLVPQINIVLYPVKYIDIDEYNDIRLYDPSKKHTLTLSSFGDMEIVWSTVVSALDTDPLKSMLVTKKSALEYIDARFGNKVFYKFTDASSNGILRSTSTHESLISTSSTTPVQ